MTSQLALQFKRIPSTLVPILLVSLASSFAGPSIALGAPNLKPVLADTKLLEKIGAPILARHHETQVGYSRLTPELEMKLSQAAHEAGRCGGFEALPEPKTLSESALELIFGELSAQAAKERRFSPSSRSFLATRAKPEIEIALSEVSESRLKETVEALSAYPSRSSQLSQPNAHVLALKARIDSLLAERISIGRSIQVELVDHSSTRQQSLRVRLPGLTRPSEIIVLGAHLDSTNQGWGGSSKQAPGADDNASGAANLLEALRILMSRPQTERTIEIIWYAGEEAGLLGSAEIAKSYRAAAHDVIAVLQLDMTLHPGDGEFTLGSMTDFTSPWLRSYLETLNELYLKARIVNDKCGYGCSDHASWHRQGYPTLMPFEASFDRMNPEIHSARDVINSSSNFRHSAMFTKIALAIALDLGNSSLRETP